MKTKMFEEQAEQKRNWVTHPTTRNFAIIVSIWIVGIVLLVASMTDLFRNSFFDKKHILVYGMMVLSTWTVIKASVNYFKTKRIVNKEFRKGK
jgi:hypothetical protein